MTVAQKQKVMRTNRVGAAIFLNSLFDFDPA